MQTLHNRTCVFAGAAAGDGTAAVEALLKGGMNVAVTVSYTHLEWQVELESQTELFDKVGKKLPAELEEQRQLLIKSFS